LAVVEDGGIDQTGNCKLGCEFSSSSAVWVPVISVEVICAAQLEQFFIH
jgi:hypothetical protein